ncbi:MAG: biotin--[acetyl-CoA-carboxylase] ligase [Parachlamydiales bacterium]|jgi:BirA family biotin operon repressor/biotin-[acetyl-CoA-carboxylase] ligase
MRLVYYHVSTIDSTNSLAKRGAAHWNREDLTAITTDEQTGGRGQYNRPWVMIKGKDIAVSYVLYTQSEHLADIPFAAAIAVDKALNIPGVHFKWPNDVFVNQKKICGILVETTPVENTTCLIIGIGINILSGPADWTGIGQPVTSYFAETSQQIVPEKLLESLSLNIAEIIPQVLRSGFSFIKNKYHLRSNKQ